MDDVGGDVSRTRRRSFQEAGLILFASGPSPLWYFSKGMQIFIGVRMGVLHCDLRSKLHVLPEGRAKWLVGGEVSGVERRHVQVYESPSLLFGDFEMSMHRNQSQETSEFLGKSIRSPERLCGEGSDMVDVVRLFGAKDRLKDWIFEDTCVEGGFQPADRIDTASVFEERRHEVGSLGG